MRAGHVFLERFGHGDDGLEVAWMQFHFGQVVFSCLVLGERNGGLES